MPGLLVSGARAARCSIYTRRSIGIEASDEQNSIRLQRDICSTYVRSQRHRGWAELAQRYDDPGHTGADLERPALRQLCADIEDGQVDIGVIYKLDRLTRSLGDFIRLIDLFEQYSVTFVSVTQAFDTQDSMGRLVLNILLTFAQFEREMLADRIRDKAAAMKRAGRWTGGAPPFGYDIVDHKLVINDAEALVVRRIFARFLELGSAHKLTVELRAEGLQAKRWTNRRGLVSGGGLVSACMIYALLGNPVYVGEFHIGEAVYRAQHRACGRRFAPSRSCVRPTHKNFPGALN